MNKILNLYFKFSFSLNERMIHLQINIYKYETNFFFISSKLILKSI